MIRSGLYLQCWWYLISNTYKSGSVIIKLRHIQWWINVILAMILVPYVWFTLKLQESENYVIYILQSGTPVTVLRDLSDLTFNIYG